MLDKIKSYQHPGKLKQLLSLSFLSQLAFAILVLLVSWSGIKVISSNYDLQKQISTLAEENSVQQLENNNLKLRNEYLGTDRYLELSAREHFNKALPGEKLLTVPHAVALSHSVDIPKPPAKQTVKTEQAWYEQNFNDWLDFLFHRS